MFDHMVDTLMATPPRVIEKKTIDSDQFRAWQQQYTFDALRGVDYGVSFCRYFDIVDLRLCFMADRTLVDHIVHKDYVCA